MGISMLDAQTNDERPLYNSRIIRNYIRLINAKYPHIDRNALLHSAGMEMFQVEDDGHWFSQRQINLFHQRLRELTGTEDISREAGIYCASPDALGLMGHYFLGLMGLAGVFYLMGKFL